ncbi:Cas9 inhibitor AcrIIA9 family protein [Clostridium sp. D33t1_170424_F3]|uniref:Cas9 inhibitor AcrIIA9 family protein n=1 Tax=Clostridium sp. D33t1_170424_F3 TaxID=2787099 RepID=UPI0018A8CD04|nr:Cas9 inhibitor AcrIIA9 family protein [Clostridium sp. D33t1_170424_F3]
MSKTQDAIMKINMEMQKDPQDRYMEIVGHYIIDRCSDDAVANAVMDSGKTLEGAMKAITAAARKKMKDSVSVMSDTDVFDAVDQYLAAGRDDAVRQAVRREVNGSGMVPAVPVQQDNLISLDFDSFI